MSKHRMPTRPGNDLENRPNYLDKLERGIFYVCVPIGTVIILGLGGGYLIHQAVTTWL